MLTALALSVIVGQGFNVPSWPRIVPNPAKLEVPQPTQPVEITEHYMGTVAASAANAKTLVWVLPAGLRIDTRKLSDGKSLYVTGAPGTYTLYEVAVDDKGTSQQFERTVIVKADAPTPPPNPTPPSPVPVPPVPVPPAPPSPPGPGKYGVAPLVFEMAMRLPQDAKVKSAAVAAAFRSLASAIGAGGVPLLSIASETRRQLDAVYGSDAKVRSAWLAIETAAIAKLKPQIKLNAADIASAYSEIGDGLAAVK